MQFATISIGSPEGVNKWVVQILIEKPTDSDYNDQSSRTAGTKPPAAQWIYVMEIKTKNK
jgi:hypothetical protein